MGLAPEALAAVGEQDQVKVLFGLDQLVHDQERQVGRDVAVHGAVGQQELPLEILGVALMKNIPRLSQRPSELP